MCLSFHLFFWGWVGGGEELMPELEDFNPDPQRLPQNYKKPYDTYLRIYLSTSACVISCISLIVCRWQLQLLPWMTGWPRLSWRSAWGRPRLSWRSAWVRPRLSWRSAWGWSPQIRPSTGSDTLSPLSARLAHWVLSALFIYLCLMQDCGSGSVLDPDAIWSVDPDPGGQKCPTKVEKN